MWCVVVHVYMHVCGACVWCVCGACVWCMCVVHVCGACVCVVHVCTCEDADGTLMHF